MKDRTELIGIFTSKDYTLEEKKQEGIAFNGRIEPHNARFYTHREAAEKIKDALTYYAWYYNLQNTRHKTETYWLIAQAILHSILGAKNENR